MSLTTADKINIGWLCGLYASNELQNGKKHGGLLDERLPSLLYSVTQGLSWLNDIAPNDADVEPIGNYLISICKHYLKALNVLDSGNSGVVPGIISGGSLFPIVKFPGDFESNGVTYNDPRIVGFNLMLWVSNYSEEWQFAPAFFIYTSTGFKIVAPGFNINDYDRIIIDDFNSNSSSIVPSLPQTPIVINYDLTVDATLITNPSGLTTDGQQVIVAIKPNGHTYTWGTMFIFSDTLPEQTDAIGTNTIQVYTFSYILAANKLIIVSESINVPI